MFGNDSVTKDIFEKTVEFIQKTKIGVAQSTIQTPLPGTALYQQFSNEGRLLLEII